VSFALSRRNKRRLRLNWFVEIRVCCHGIGKQFQVSSELVFFI
jgi:hypothetical protein